MFKLPKLTFLLLLVCNCAAAQVPVRYTIVDSSFFLTQVPDEMKDWKWHRFETNNFEILSIDREQSFAIANYCEDLKLWGYDKWGIKDIQYKRKCLILTIPDVDTFRKWYKAEDIDPKLALSKSLDGSNREVYAIWIVGTGDYLTSSLPEKITRVNLLNFEDTFNVKLPYWMHVGMGVLANSVPSVKSLLRNLDPNGSYSCEVLFQKTLQEGEPKASKDDFRARAATFCLFLRKQQNGGMKFAQLLEMAPKSNEQGIQVFGFKGNDQLNLSYNTYTRNLAYDLRNNKTPDLGISWLVMKRK